MARVPRAIAAALHTVILASAVVVTAAALPANAVACSTSSGVGRDSAWISEGAGSSCTYIAVRHYYDPVWSASNYWTSWYGGSGSYYSTRETPVLIRYQTETY